MIKPLVYVIVVTYNGSKWINSCLDSLKKSTIPVKTIVIDNNSNDNTISIIAENHPEVILHQSKINLGFGKANNLGIKQAIDSGSDYVFLLNQDAWIQPHTLEILININKNYPEYYIISPMHLDGPGNNLDHSFSVHISPNNTKELVSDLILKNKALKDVYPTPFVNAAFWLISRDCIEEVGFFDTIFPHYGEDNDYLNRVTFHNKKIGISPITFGYHDRDQNPVDISNFNFSKRLARQKIASLIIMMNINNSLLKSVLRFFKNRLEFLLDCCFKLNFRNLYVEIVVTLTIPFYLVQILKHRSFNKLKRNL